MNKYRIYEFAIQDEEYYPKGMNVKIAYEKDEKAIKEDNIDDSIYHYVWEKEIDLDNISIGDTLILDKEFTIVGGTDAKEKK